MNEKLTEKLKKIDFIEGQNLFSIEDAPENPYIHLSLIETKKLFPKVSYVYFRQFPQESRSPLAQAFIFDFPNETTLPESFGAIVKNIWLTGKIPLIYAFTKTEVNIISGYKQPNYKDDSYDITILDKIELADLANNKIFSAKRLDNGSFWDDESYAKHFDFKQSPYEILLNKIKQMLEDVVEIEDKLLPKDAKPFYQKLLLRSILVKYLEDRRDETGGVFREGYFSEISGTEDKFIYILKQPGAIIELFKNLEKDFNGNIFALSDYEKNILQSKDLSAFTDVFYDNVDEHSQMHIWELYSFNYLPIELISNIYEEFMPKTKGVVYTPPFLVDFLIDQSMQLKDLIKRDDAFRVIDPSCGSGVFLVAAYKRLVEVWKIKNQNHNPSIDVLKDILSNCIYGIDLQKESIELAAFSLTIALCDQLSPKSIRDLRFDDLATNNLLNQDFFTIILNEENRYNDLLDSFDLVIGNPPFDSHLTTIDAKKVEQRQLKHRDCKLPDNQLALLFLEQSFELLKVNGALCLIQKASPFLYNTKGHKYRKWLFESFNINRILDFTAIDSILFEKRNVASLAIIAEKCTVHNVKIEHIIVRRTKAVKEKMFFEIDKYDFHLISLKETLNNPLVWKSNLLGGGRLNRLAYRFSKIDNLQNHIKKHKKWVVGEGFITATASQKQRIFDLQNDISYNDGAKLDLEKLLVKYTASHLTNYKTIPSKPFSIFDTQGIKNDKLVILNEKYFYRSAKRKKEIFQPPHLIIREVVKENGIPIELREDYLTFKNQMIGIHAPQDDKYLLSEIEGRIKSMHKIYTFFFSIFSCVFLVDYSSKINEDDILSIPYPKNPDELNLTSFEQILIDDVLNYQIEFRRKGENAKVMKPATSTNLDDFAGVFLKVINSVYKEFKAAEPIETNSFICYPFYFGDKPEQDLQEFENNTEVLEMHLESLLKHQPTSTLRINRILKIYEKNIIYLIKPNQLRYWLKSIAIRDADDTVADFIEQGF